MTHLVLRLAILAALVSSSDPAWAQGPLCWDRGNRTVCDNGQTFTHEPDGRTSRDDRGNTYRHYGGPGYGWTWDDRGRTWDHYGPLTVGPDGRTCQRVGSMTMCN